VKNPHKQALIKNIFRLARGIKRSNNIARKADLKYGMLANKQRSFDALKIKNIRKKLQNH